MTASAPSSPALRRYQGVAPTLGERVYVDPAAVVIGDVTLGSDTSVWPCAVIRGDMHRIRIGERTSIQDNSCLHITHAGPFNPEGYPLTIGDDVTRSEEHTSELQSRPQLVCRPLLEKIKEP